LTFDLLILNIFPTQAQQFFPLFVLNFCRMFAAVGTVFPFVSAYVCTLEMISATIIGPLLSMTTCLSTFRQLIRFGSSPPNWDFFCVLF
jgi:hypothetical protein